MMKRMEPGGNEYSGKCPKTPGNAAMQCCCYKIDSEINRKPTFRGCPKHQHGNEPNRIRNEMIHRMEASCGRKIQLLLRMVLGVKGPHETASMLKSVNPVIAEVCNNNPESSLHDRVEFAHKTELYERKLCTKETEKRRHKQKLV